MANSREGQLQRDINKDMTARGWMAGTAVGYVRKWEYFSELQLFHYRLTKREAERQRLEMAGEDCVSVPRPAMSAQASSTIPRSCTSPTASPTASNVTKR